MAQLRHSMRWRHWLPWLFSALLTIFCNILCNTAHAAPLVQADADFAQIDLAKYIDLFVDESGRLTIDEIAREPLANEFVRTDINTFHQNINERGAYWLRFGVANPLPQSRVLILNLRLPHNIEIDAFNTELQPLQLRRPAQVQLLIPPQSKQLYYIRIGSSSLKLAQFDLLTLDRQLNNYRHDAWFDGVLQGGLIFIAISAMLAGTLRRDSIYFWLAGACFAFQLFQIVFSADVNPLFFEYASTWSYLHPLPQLFLLFATFCSLRLAQSFSVITSESAFCAPLLPLLQIATIALIPAVFFAPALHAARLDLVVSTLSIVCVIIIALYSFVLSRRRSLLFYALARTPMLMLAIAGVMAWQVGSDIKSQVRDSIPIATMIEAIGLLALLIWRSFEQQRQHACDEREIAVLEAEARSRTEVGAEVGHRVRTPVSGVLGMLDMLQDTSLSTTQLDYLNTIRRASNELLNVIDEISDVSRLHAHTSKLQQNIFDPQALAAECVDGFRSLASAHQLELINDIAPELPAYVSGDLTRLRQILLQLLHQAVSQHECGEIVLRVYPLQRHWLRFDIETRAQIAQIAPSEIDRRLNPPGSANVRFAIARQLIDMLGGRVQVDDLADGNLHAWFDMPLPIVERDESSHVQDTVLQGKQLLVVDDNATFCDVLRRQLSHWGLSVYTANSASEGLARLRNQLTLSQPIDVLLIDADMPELQHCDWLPRVHAEIGPEPLIILLSSKAELHPVLPHALNVRRVLLKPVNHTSLKITLIEEFKQRAQRALPAPRASNQPIRCLFAEDNMINAKVLAGMLGKLGVDYTATSNGQEAVEACQRDRFDIVLMDCDMPVMDGWEASQRIREMFENRSMPAIPIIALTANTVEELGERARQPVMDAHLVKPIRLQSLRELLEQWTGKIVTPPADVAS